MQSRDKTAYLAALSLLMSAAELMVPRILPFFRLGLANIPLLMALGLDWRSYLMLLLLKAVGNAYISGTLFSVFALMSLAQTLASGSVMYVLGHLPGNRISVYGISLLGALASSVTQIAVAALYVGRGTLAFLPLIILLSLPSSILVAFLSQRLEIPAELPEAEEDPAEKETRWQAPLSMLAAAGAVMMTKSIILLLPALAVSMAFQRYAGRRIYLMPHLLTMLFMVVSSLLTPSGRVVAEVASIPVTEDALAAGVAGALRLSACMALSQAFSRVIVPSGGLIGKTLYFFSAMQSSFRATEGRLTDRVSEALELKATNKTTNTPINIPAFILFLIPALLITLSVLGFLFY